MRNWVKSILLIAVITTILVGTVIGVGYLSLSVGELLLPSSKNPISNTVTGFWTILGGGSFLVMLGGIIYAVKRKLDRRDEAKELPPEGPF